MHGKVHANQLSQKRGVFIVLKSLICKSQYPMESCFAEVSSSVHCLLESRFFITVCKVVLFLWGHTVFWKGNILSQILQISTENWVSREGQFSKKGLFRHKYFKFSKLQQKTGFLGRVVKIVGEPSILGSLHNLFFLCDGPIKLVHCEKNKIT